MDLERLAKLLAMAGSDKEHEALSALRAANRMLKAAGYDWRDLLSRRRDLSFTEAMMAALDDEEEDADPEYNRRTAAALLDRHEKYLLIDDRRFLQRVTAGKTKAHADDRDRIKEIKSRLSYMQQWHYEAGAGEDDRRPAKKRRRNGPMFTLNR
jgi:hypothetical protein